MKRRQIVSALVVGLIAVGVAAVVLTVPGHHAAKGHGTAVRRLMPVPGTGEGEQFGAMDTYWNDRLTYAQAGALFYALDKLTLYV